MHYCFIFATRNIISAASINRAVENLLASLGRQGIFCLDIGKSWVDRTLSCKVDFLGSLTWACCQFTQISFKSTIGWKLLCKISNQLFDGSAKDWGVGAFVPFENSKCFVYFESFLDESVDLFVAQVLHHGSHLSCWKYVFARIHQIGNSGLGIILDGKNCRTNRSYFTFGLSGLSFDFGKNVLISCLRRELLVNRWTSDNLYVRTLLLSNKSCIA